MHEKILAETLQEIERTYGNSSIRESKMREVFEDWLQKNSVVQDIMAGYTTFYKEYQATFGKNPIKEGDQMTNLEYCIGNSLVHQSRPEAAADGAAFMGAGTVIYVTLANLCMKKEGESLMERRKFLRVAAKIGAVAVSAGSGMELGLNSLSRFATKYGMKQNALYLDKLYVNLFPKSL